MGPRAWAHGAHLATQVERIEQSSTALAAPPTSFLPYRLPRGGSLPEGGMIPKHDLRAAARANRKRLAEASPLAGERATAFVADMLGARPLHTAALYVAQGSEIDALPLARSLVKAGLDLCLPVVIERDAAMIFRRWAPGDPLLPDAQGMPAPLGDAETLAPDLIITPLLAFDRSGGRLGQGGGYYDRTFAAFPNAWRIGLAYAGQEVENLPGESHDVPLHGVLTDVGHMLCISH